MDEKNESKITKTFSPGVSNIIRKIAAQRGIDTDDVCNHAFMLEYWAHNTEISGDDVCHRNGRTGKLTIMNLPWPEPKHQTESPLPPVAAKKIKLRLVVNNPDAQPSPPRLLAPLQSVADPAADPEDEGSE